MASCRGKGGQRHSSWSNRLAPGLNGLQGQRWKQGQTPRPSVPYSRTFQGFAHAIHHLECPALLSIQSNPNLDLQALLNSPAKEVFPPGIPASQYSA